MINSESYSCHSFHHVSVIIPTYNCAQYITRAIDSIFNEDYPSFEVIVIDDGSTDETRDVLKPYINRIHYVYHENSRSASARNLGLRLATGEFIVFLDADDFFLPGKLAKQLAVFDSNPALGGVHSGWKTFDKKGNEISSIEPWHYAPNLDLKTWLLWKPVNFCAFMFRRIWLERVGGLNPELLQAHDVDLILRLSLAGCRFDWLREPTVGYRLHDSNTTLDVTEQAQSINLLLNNFFSRPDLPRRILKLENHVRFYTLVWLAWHAYRSCSSVPEITAYLHLSLAYTFYPISLTVLHWLDQLSRHSIDQGVDVDKLLRVFRSHFKAAAQVDGPHWFDIERLLSWTKNVWQYYQTGDHRRAARGLEAYPYLTQSELVRFTQLSIIAGPTSPSNAAVTRIWSDAYQCGIVSTLDHHEVTILYLTVFIKAILIRRLSLGLRSIDLAIRNGFRLKALRIWLRFLRTPVNCLLCRRRASHLWEKLVG